MYISNVVDTEYTTHKVAILNRDKRRDIGLWKR